MNPSSSTSTLHLPLFVYGTLRTGEANHYRFGKTILSAQEAILPHATLWNLGPYPMVTEDEGASNSQVQGELFDISPAHYDRILKSLDRLEGVNYREPEKPGGLFHRARRQVLTEQGQVMAWVYYGRQDLAQRGKIIESGNWKKRQIRQGTP